jgi:hypothetical protein
MTGCGMTSPLGTDAIWSRNDDTTPVEKLRATGALNGCSVMCK